MPPKLSINPQLPPVAQGVYTDPEYAAEEAQLRANTIRDYGDVLQNLGYTDEQGNYIPGLTELAYQRQEGDINRGLGQAEENVGRIAQQQGTLFSGRRADQVADAQYGLRRNLAQATEQLPIDLSNLYNRASGLIGNYTLGRNSLLAQALGRYVPPAIVAPPPAADPGAPGGPGAPVAPVVPPAGHTGALHDPDLITSIPPGQRPASPAFLARGAVVRRPTEAVIGEAGPEAVVPLKSGLPAAIQRLRQMYAGDKSFGQGIDEANFYPPTDVNVGIAPPPVPRPVHPGIAWGGQHFVDPESLVAWMNARGADTTEEQFLTNHPGVAAEFGQRQAAQQQAPQRKPQSGAGGQQVARPNVHAKGLKAAASILNELAKQHEHEQGGGAPPRPAMQSSEPRGEVNIDARNQATAVQRLRAAFPRNVQSLYGRS